MADEPKAQELVGSLPKQSWRRNGDKEWDKKKVLPSSKHCSLAETGMQPNEVIARMVWGKKRRCREKQEERHRAADNDGMTVPCRIGRSISSTVRHPHQKMSLLQQLFHFLSTRCQEIARTFAQAWKKNTHTHFNYIVKTVHVPTHACNTHLIKLQQVNMISLSGAQHAACGAMHCL